jgi:hypothetical protein
MKEVRRFRIFLGQVRLSGVAFVLLILCFLTASPISLQEAVGKVNKKAQIKRYEGHVSFAQEFARMGNICIQFGGSMTAASFFQNLQATASTKGIEYSKDGHRVETFPQTISIVIIAVPRMCNRQPSEDLNAEAHDFMDELQFEPDWKFGIRMQKAKDFNREKPQHDLRELPLLGPGALADVWEYRMKISGADIPLSAHLIVSAFDKDRRFITRLSASL